MKFNNLVVVIPAKWLPQNKEQARAQVWTMTSQLLLPHLGKLYSRLYPAACPWEQNIADPFGVVLGQEDPVTFLNLFYQAKKKQERSVSFHMDGMLKNLSSEQTQRIGDSLICYVTADGSNEALTSHTIWNLMVSEGTLLPDCGLYYLEQKRALVSPEQEKAVSSHPGDYALCAVTLEDMEGAS